MTIAFYGDSLTRGLPGASYFDPLAILLPGRTLINFGKGGDTTLSLTQRIRRRKLLLPVDAAFVWIGVNDVLAHLTWVSPVVKTVLNQPWAADRSAFRAQYRDLLALISPHAARIVAVSPLCIGERLDNRWNRELDELSAIIREGAAGFSQAAFLGLHTILAERLASLPISDYLPMNPLHAVVDALTLHTPADVDRAAASRGLHFTLDGVHLNSAGAALVAEAFVAMLPDQKAHL
jgi:lysophospholipase L1-like esterase